jgi:hypothetical protein
VFQPFLLLVWLLVCWWCLLALLLLLHPHHSLLHAEHTTITSTQPADTNHTGKCFTEWLWVHTNKVR